MLFICLSSSLATVDRQLCVTIDGRVLAPPKTVASYGSIINVPRLGRHRAMSLSVVGRILRNHFPLRAIVAERLCNFDFVVLDNEDRAYVASKARSGRTNAKVEPLPGVLSRRIEPPC